MWTWETRRQRQRRNARKAVGPPDVDVRAFVVPNYTRGAPYVDSIPDYADSPEIRHNHFPYRTTTQIQASYDKQTYPTAGRPPQEWKGYKTESWTRSEQQEHVLNGREGKLLVDQRRYQSAENPYYKLNKVDRPQRQVHEYSFLRPYDKGVLGMRLLNGMHLSQAQIGQGSAPLRGMQAPMRRRSTYRLEPLQYSVATVDNQSGSVPVNMTFTSPGAVYPSRAYRL